MSQSRQAKTQTILNILNIIGLLITIAMVVWGIKIGIFTDKDKMLHFINGLGVWGPSVFMLIQVAQTVIPVMPGAITIPIWMLAFGPLWGMIYNLLPIYLGSFINFWISRLYGKPTVRAILGEKSFNSMINLFEKRHIGERLFTFLMFIPFSPADILCYGAGLTNMKPRYFNYSLLFGKPVSLAFYAFGTTYLLEWLFQFL